MHSSESALRRAFKQLAYRLGRLYPIKPQYVSEGTELCSILQGHRFATTLGRLSKSGDDPQQIVTEYQQASSALVSSTGCDRFYLSVKPPALNFDLKLCAAIAARALENGHGVHFDSHKFHEADPTLKLLDGLIEACLPACDARHSWNFSLSLATRWRRSREDAGWAARRGVRVRLVKGDFAAQPSEEVDPVAGFVELAGRLAGQVPELALATHDSQVAREAIRVCRDSGTSLQIELFFGRPARAMLALARETGVPVRFYVPYGDTLIVYLVRDLLTNPLKLLRSDALELLGSPEVKLARITGAL
jgi:proline dehydrogenase